MNLDRARQVTELLMRLSQRVNKTAEEVFATSTPYNGKRYQKLAGDVIGEIFINVLSRLYQDYPELEPPEIRPPANPGPAIDRGVAAKVLSTMSDLRDALTELDSADTEDAWFSDAVVRIRDAVQRVETHVLSIHPDLLNSEGSH
jgi:hypothetical protein